MIYYHGFSMPHGDPNAYPYSLPAFQKIDQFTLRKPITIFVGENGSGKSTLLKGIAMSMNLPSIGSSALDLDDSLSSLRDFANQLRGSWSKRVYNGFFFRAEDYFGFAKRLNQIDAELANDIVDFEKKLTGFGLKQAVGSIHGQKEALRKKYGNLHEVSHGEGFLKVLQSRMNVEGIYLIDEPEAALSPQRQLSLYTLIKNLAQENNCQFILATHSPILMTLPDSQLFEFGDEVREMDYEDTEHFSIMKQFLNNPEAFTRFL